MLILDNNTQVTNIYGPNTTVLLPGKCNAKCDFCFWDRNEGSIRPELDTYLNKVFNNLSKLPKTFSTLSISGGEPTLSPYFRDFLVELLPFIKTRRKFDKIVLTTNGTKLLYHINNIKEVVNHINISRHGLNSEENYKIFKTTSIPSDEELSKVIEIYHNTTNLDITLNCVINDNTTIKFIYDFIDYAKKLKADAVSFRKEASDVTPTQAELYFRERYGVLAESKCIVCRGMNQNVNGFDVRWKGTVNEPSLETKGIYEAVIHPDGNCYSDWNMKERIKIKKEKINKSDLIVRLNKLQEEINKYS